MHQSGATVLSFPGIAASNYFVSVRHRNHLGVMTAGAVPLSIENSTIDFSLTDTPVYGEHARLETATAAFLWAGDSDQNNRLLLKWCWQ